MCLPCATMGNSRLESIMREVTIAPNLALATGLGGKTINVVQIQPYTC